MPEPRDNDTEEDSTSPASAGNSQTSDITEKGQPWRDENGILTYATFADFEKDKNNIGRPPPDGRLVRVVDGYPNYANKNFFWIATSPSQPEGDTLIQSLASFNKQRIEAGGQAFVPPGARQIDEFQGIPIFRSDPNSSDVKPESNTGTTTSRTTGTTTSTTTSYNSANNTTTTTSTVEQNQTTTPAAATATQSAANRTTSQRTAPTPVTGQRAQPTATSSSGNAYVYEPIKPGFDRYDFNSGKKVFTPDTGSSLQTYVGSNAPTTPARAAEANRTAADPGIDAFGGGSAYTAADARNVEDLRRFNADLGGGPSSAKLTPGERAYAIERGYIRSPSNRTAPPVGTTGPS